MESKALQQVRKMVLSPIDRIRTMAIGLLAKDVTMENMVRIWHTAMGAPVRTTPSSIPVEDMERRLRLILEEYSETVKAAGFKFISKSTGQDLTGDITVAAIPGATQDLEEITDGLGDITVVTLGTAVEMGLPIRKAYVEIMLSNATKLPMDGITIFNRCTAVDTDSSHTCETQPIDCVLIDPSAPVNKILKPSGYAKADILSILSGAVELDNTSQDTFVFPA